MKSTVTECEVVREPQAVYANYFQFGHNAFEFFLDLGQWFNAPESAHLHRRIIATPSEVKGLLGLLRGPLTEFEEIHSELTGDD